MAEIARSPEAEKLKKLFMSGYEKAAGFLRFGQNTNREPPPGHTLSLPW